LATLEDVADPFCRWMVACGLPRVLSQL